MEFFKQQNKWVWGALLAIVAIGAFVRVYYLSDWTHFELDQSRDAKVVLDAVRNGAENLPLLGPRAGGTFLRLGPGFYYLEYLGALIFGATPSGLVWPITLLSIASIGVLYVFLRRYFGIAIALGMTALFAVSPFFVLYGRFAWNPNPLPFFLLGGFYSLLCAVDDREVHRERWFLTAAFLLAFATHLHFLAFVSVPAIVVIFLGVKRARFSWRAWVGALAIAVTLYAPVLLNETITAGANTRQFLEAVSGKSNKGGHSLPEQVVRNVVNQSLGYWTILTGDEAVVSGQFVSRGDYDFELICGDTCHKRLPSGLASLALFALGAMLLVWRRYKVRDTHKRDFLTLSLVWFGVYFALFTPLSFDAAPRFFLLIAPFPFLFLGLIAESLMRARMRRAGALVAFILVVIVLVFASLHTAWRLDELRRAPSESFEVAPDRILKEKTRVTLEQQQSIVEYMVDFQKQDGYPIYMWSEPEHKRALKFLIEETSHEDHALGINDGHMYAKGHFFLVIRTLSDHSNALSKFDRYDVVEKRSFGTLTVFHLQPKSEFITRDRQTFKSQSVKDPEASSTTPGVPDRYTWSQWWHHNPGTTDDESESE